MKLLSVNAGSSSLKFKLYNMPEEKVLVYGYIDKLGNKADVKIIINDSIIQENKILKIKDNVLEKCLSGPDCVLLLGGAKFRNSIRFLTASCLSSSIGSGQWILDSVGTYAHVAQRNSFRHKNTHQ